MAGERRGAVERRSRYLSRHPQAQSLDVRPHDLETYDELARHSNHTNDDEPQR